MPSEPVPFVFQLFFYGSVIMTVILSAIAVGLYRRTVLRYMNSRDASGTFSPVPAGNSSVAGLANEPAARYAVAERRLRMRLAQIYGGAIIAVVAFAVWIRFFSGNTALIRGSIMFMMWREPLGDLGAFVLSVALFSAIGLPILAILLAWSWRRAIAVFVLYVWTWAAGAFISMILLKGMRTADWTSTLILVQIFLISLIALQPFLLMLVTGNQRVRAVVPLTFAGASVFFASLIGLFFLLPKINLLAVGLHVPDLPVQPGDVFFALGAIALIGICRSVLRLLANLYERKVFSDRQLLVDCWMLMIILYVFSRLGESPGTPQLLIGLAFAIFCVYRFVIEMALRLSLCTIERSANRRLLLLRTFNYQAQTEKLFDVIIQRWRFYGSVLMIAGPDLAARAINPVNYLYFLSRRLRQRFIRTEADLQHQLDRLDDRPDPDGRYRINELFCNDQAWGKAVVALLDRADLVLMDLRGFGPANQGCVYEIRQLVWRAGGKQVFLAVDQTTDVGLIDTTVREALSHMPRTADSGLASGLILFPMKKSSPHAMDAIFAALQGEMPIAYFNDSKNRGVAWHTNAISKPLSIFSCNPADTESADQAGVKGDRSLKRMVIPLSGITATALAIVLESAGPSSLVRWYEGTTGIYKSAHRWIDASDYFETANRLYDQGRYNDSIGLLNKAIEINPEWGEANHNLGVNLDRIGDYTAAIAAYRRAADLMPNLAVTHYNLGADLDHTGQYDEAIAEYLKALDLDPKLADAHYNLGVVLERQGKTDAAIAAYRKALTAMPEMVDAHYNLGVNLFRKGDARAAIAELHQALALKPDNFEAHVFLGGVFYQTQQTEAAIEEFQKALSLKPDSFQVHYNLAVIHFDQGEYEAAIDECRMTLDTEPGHVKCRYLSAIALHATGQEQAAELQLQEAQRRNPELKRPWN